MRATELIRGILDIIDGQTHQEKPAPQDTTNYTHPRDPVKLD